MRILLDENLDWRLRRDLPRHQVESVPLLGWAGIQNGELLRKAVVAGFEALVTMDEKVKPGSGQAGIRAHYRHKRGCRVVKYQRGYNGEI
jgi:hypothetical protein